MVAYENHYFIVVRKSVGHLESSAVNWYIDRIEGEELVAVRWPGLPFCPLGWYWLAVGIVKVTHGCSTAHH